MLGANARQWIKKYDKPQKTPGNIREKKFGDKMQTGK
jgi:hypothetical protein